MAAGIGISRESNHNYLDFLKIFFQPTDIESKPDIEAQTGTHKMPVSNLQIYNAVIAYNKQKELSSSLRRKKSIAPTLNTDKESTFEEENIPPTDVEEKDAN